MLTALDIQNKEFTRGMRGYKEEEVDAFLDEIIVDYQNLVNENEALKARLNDATGKVSEYKSTEGAVITTLESAKALMNDIAQSAEKRANLLIKNAEIDAELRVRQANDQVAQLRMEEERVQKRVMGMKNRLKSILEAELVNIESINAEITDEQ